jgi:hypothetical protein
MHLDTLRILILFAVLCALFIIALAGSHLQRPAPEEAFEPIERTFVMDGR